MAASNASGPGLSAFLAVGAAIVQALATPSGPWQPASVILGWAAVFLVTMSLLTGHTWALAAGCATFLVRTGIHGLAGEGLADLALSAALLLTVTEFGATSLEGRLMPVHWPSAAARSLLVGAGGGGVVVVVAALVGGSRFEGGGAAAVGLTAAVLTATAIVALSRPLRGPS